MFRYESRLNPSKQNLCGEHVYCGGHRILPEHHRGNADRDRRNNSDAPTTSPSAGRRRDVAVNSATNTIYVTSLTNSGGGNGTVTVINGTSLATQTVQTGYDTYSVGDQPVTNTIYATNLCGNSVDLPERRLGNGD